MLRRRVKDVLKRRVPGLVRLRDAVRDWTAPDDPAPATHTTAAEPPPRAEPALYAEPLPPAEPALDAEAIQALLDDMVRHALQSDGGDITLVKVDGVDVHVSLVGACHTCPSATVTMRMGVERLLKEEFPQMGRLVEVGGALHL